ncbi:microtubule-actin cross-linking factor 1-like [Callorhinchus milii]|uniref:microtubule-actin cross-linking factor 1-like n=1 Tax=Callorhinchus milii TaxID=7868 RepID=UPI001C3FAD90|nr:microtubule-actin cross-linking factor 1-like [Callorhinchus milii]
MAGRCPHPCPPRRAAALALVSSQPGISCGCGPWTERRGYRSNGRGYKRSRADFEHFDFSSWRCRYMQWIADRKCRLLDVFRSIDREQRGLVSREHFIHNVLTSKFPTNSLEMAVVADVFDLNADGFIDYWDFTSVLHPSRDALRLRDSHTIHDEVSRQVAQCNCVKRFLVERISANRYRFGNSQRMRMVRVLRCTVMVRVGGGWSALDEFLVKNDPCRVKGRTNIKLKERYLTPEGHGTPTSQVAASPPTWNSVRTTSSCMSAPSSPRARKSVVRRSRSGDRSQSHPQSRNSFALEEAEFKVCTASTCRLAASDVDRSVVLEAEDAQSRDSTSGCDQRPTNQPPVIGD